MTSDVDSSAQNASVDDSSICTDKSNYDINKAKVHHNNSFDFDDSYEEADYNSSSSSDSEMSFNEVSKSFKVKAIVHRQPEPYPSSYNDSVETVAEIINISSDSEVSEINSDLSPVKPKYSGKNIEVWYREEPNDIQEKVKGGAGLFDSTDPEEFSRLQLSLSDLDENSFTEIKQMSTSKEAERAVAKSLNRKKFLPKKKTYNDDDNKHFNSVIELSDDR